MSTRTFGYSDAANYQRRARMILADLYSQYSNLDSVPLTFADYGSNFGWFSCLLAKELPRSQVFSIEGGIQTDAIEGKGVNFHRAFLQEHSLENNIVCNARFGHETFNVFEASDIRFDVQLLMSVVHWVEKWPAYKGTRTSWEQHVCTWLSAARMSYVEMVNPRGQVREGRDKYHPVWTWYAKREDEKLILVETLQSCGLRAHVHEVLSSSTISHTSAGNAHIRRLHVLQNEEERRMFRVKLLDTDPTPLTMMKKKLTCEAVLGAIGCAACKDTLTQSSNKTQVTVSADAGGNSWLDSKLSYMSTRTFGYSDAANYQRRARMILADLYSQYSNLDSVPLTFADYGSNFGWFSCLLAKELPRSQVFSIEGGIQTDAIEGKGVNFHRAFLQEHSLENNIVCNARFGHETFNVFEASDIRFDVQLLMSVVHWVEKWPAYKGTRTSWEQHVCTWLSAARMSYVEMVNPRGQVREGRDKYHPVWTWYAKREDEKLILVETLQSCGLRAHVHEVLSSSTISHTSAGNAHIRRLHVLQNEEERRMFRVKLLDTDPTPLTMMKKKLTCEAVLGAIGCAACKDT